MHPQHLYRAAMEGATYSLKYGYELLMRAGMRFSRITLTGGGANSAAWRQLVADVFKLPVEIPCHGESAAFGAALQALWAQQKAQGRSVSMAEIASMHATTDPTLGAVPDTEKSHAYAMAYQRFLSHLEIAKSFHSNRSSTT